MDGPVFLDRRLRLIGRPFSTCRTSKKMKYFHRPAASSLSLVALTLPSTADSTAIFRVYHFFTYVQLWSGLLVDRPHASIAVYLVYQCLPRSTVYQRSTVYRVYRGLPGRQ